MKKHTPLPQIDMATISAPIDTPYDETMDAREAIKKGLLNATISGNPLLLNLGGNWCPDARALAGMLDIPVIQNWVAENFEVLFINIGHYDANIKILAEYGILNIEGVPTLALLAEHHQLLARSNEFRNARQRTLRELLNFLAAWRELAP